MRASRGRTETPTAAGGSSPSFWKRLWSSIRMQLLSHPRSKDAAGALLPGRTPGQEPSLWPSPVWFLPLQQGDRSPTALCLVYSFAHGIPIVTALLLLLFFLLPLFLNEVYHNVNYLNLVLMLSKRFGSSLTGEAANACAAAAAARPENPPISPQLCSGGPRSWRGGHTAEVFPTSRVLCAHSPLCLPQPSLPAKHKASPRETSINSVFLAPILGCLVASGAPWRLCHP